MNSSVLKASLANPRAWFSLTEKRPFGKEFQGHKKSNLIWLLRKEVSPLSNIRATVHRNRDELTFGSDGIQKRFPATTIQFSNLLLLFLSSFQVQVGEYDSIHKWPIYPRYTFTLLDQRDEHKDRKDISAHFEPQSISRPCADRQLGKGARRFVLQEDICASTYCKDNTVFLKFNVTLKQPPSSFFRV